MQQTKLPSINGKGSMPSEHLSVIDVTPDMAAHWLAQGGANRNVSRRRVETYMAAMKRGEWRLTYEAIKLDADGKVRDGQHRLHAIVESGLVIKMLVVWGVEESAFDVMDTGRTRTVSDILSIHDIEKSDALSSVVRFLVLWEHDHSHGVYGSPRTIPTVTAPMTMHYLEQHPDVTQWLDAGNQIMRANVRGGRALWSGLLTIFGRIDREQTHEFAEAIVSDANLGPGSPMLTLRKQLINLPGGSANRSMTNRTCVWVIKAWNAHRKGIHIYQLKWGQDEAFPEPE